jgi:hypothetical protein
MLHVNTDKLLTEIDKWQIRPLVREGAPQRQDSNFQTTTFGQKAISGHKYRSGLDTLIYWLTVSCNVTSASPLRFHGMMLNLQISAIYLSPVGLFAI